MANKTAKRSTRAAGKARIQAKEKELAHKADKAVDDIGMPLVALQNIGAHMKDCPFTGWTMHECVASLTARVRAGAAAMPIPTDRKAATLVRGLMREAQAAIEALDEGTMLLGEDFECGMKSGDGAATIGEGIGSLANKAGVAIESAAALMGADRTMFCFYSAPKKEQAEEREVKHA